MNQTINGFVLLKSRAENALRFVEYIKRLQAIEGKVLCAGKLWGVWIKKKELFSRNQTLKGFGRLQAIAGNAFRFSFNHIFSTIILSQTTLLSTSEGCLP